MDLVKSWILSDLSKYLTRDRDRHNPFTHVGSQFSETGISQYTLNTEDREYNGSLPYAASLVAPVDILTQGIEDSDGKKVSREPRYIQMMNCVISKDLHLSMIGMVGHVSDDKYHILGIFPGIQTRDVNGLCPILPGSILKITAWRFITVSSGAPMLRVDSFEKIAAIANVSSFVPMYFDKNRLKHALDVPNIRSMIIKSMGNTQTTVSSISTSDLLDMINVDECSERELHPLQQPQMVADNYLAHIQTVVEDELRSEDLLNLSAFKCKIRSPEFSQCTNAQKSSSLTINNSHHEGLIFIEESTGLPAHWTIDIEFIAKQNYKDLLNV